MGKTETVCAHVASIPGLVQEEEEKLDVFVLICLTLSLGELPNNIYL